MLGVIFYYQGLSSMFLFVLTGEVTLIVFLCFGVQLKSMLHNINFFLDSLVKGDLREVKGVRTSFLMYISLD